MIRHVCTYWQEIVDAQTAYRPTQSDSTGGSMDMTLRCILKLAHREPAAYWGRSLISTIALLHVQNNCDDRQKLVASEI